MNIYALKDPRDGVVRYIGSTVDPSARFRSHMVDDHSNERKCAWVLELKSEGMEPIMEIIETTSADNYTARERWFILQHSGTVFNRQLPFDGVGIRPTRIEIDNQTKSAVAAAARRSGMTPGGWFIRVARRTLGLSDEVPPVREMTLEDRLSASVKEAKK